MIIDLDMGNSRLKWRESTQCAELHVQVTEDELFSSWRTLAGVERVRVAAVVDAGRVDAVRSWCLREWQIEIEVAAVVNNLSGLRVAYEDVAALGVDRWLSMQAAKKQFDGKDIVVVSAGTALTVDYLTGEGRHLGGYIFPGWRAALKGLLEGVSGIRSSAAQLTSEWYPGVSTQGCLEAGIALGYRSLVRSATRVDLPGFSAKNIVLTGGDGEVMMRYLEGVDPPSIFAQLLVLQGLDVVLP